MLRQERSLLSIHKSTKAKTLLVSFSIVNLILQFRELRKSKNDLAFFSVWKTQKYDQQIVERKNRRALIVFEPYIFIMP